MYCQVGKAVDMLDFSINQGVEITKATNSISYHCGGLETRRNKTVVTKQQKSRLKRKISNVLRRIKN